MSVALGYAPFYFRKECQMTEDETSILSTIVIICVCVVIHTIGWERLPKRIQSGLEKAGRKLVRWRRENPIIRFELSLAPGEKQRQDAILDWLNQMKASLKNGGQGLW